jgi:hypothetical protein
VVAPFINATVPVAVVEETVAVNVNAVPKVEGVEPEARTNVVVEPAAVIVWAKAGVEVLPT